jgi:putative ABC transport system substrate-binding protein
MRRRDFLGGVGCAAVAWPVTARAQRTGPVVGVLGSVSPGTIQQPLARMLRALNEAGLVDGRNLFLEYRWANGQYDQLPVFAADFVSRRVDLIIALGGTALAAKAATQTIPIVALFGGDPVAAGLVAKFNRPGANVTGVTLLAFSFGPKRLELLRELREAKVITVLTNHHGGGASRHA